MVVKILMHNYSIILMMQDTLKLPLQFYWQQGPGMPAAMSRYVQSVVVQGRLYVGGGATVGREHTVMIYNISSGKWATLPPYRTCFFAMAAIKNQLVLVGGEEQNGGGSKVLGVWDTESQDWTHPYPKILTERIDCSVVTYNQWLVVAGNYPRSHLCPVEVLNTESKQWYTGPTTPTPWSCMKTAVVGDMGYFMGGFTGESEISKKMYRVHIPTLISRITSGESPGQIWKEICGQKFLAMSTPLSVSGSLLAVGGQDEDDKTVTAIHLYHPHTDEWVKVGDLPSPRHSCTCAMIADREVLVGGGQDEDNLQTVDLAQIC